MTCCCSSHCKKYFDCRLADINNEGINLVNDYHEWGSCSYTDEGCAIEYCCGELGNYKMFEPVERINMEVNMKFPFQYVNQYLSGEISLDDAVNRTVDEVDRLIREYVEKHNLKT